MYCTEKVNFQFEEYLHLQATSCYVLPTKYLLISSIHCELCTLKQYSRVFRLLLSERQPC